MKKTAAVERREQAYAWAREFGAVGGLGDCRGVYEQVHGRISLRGCGTFLILAAVLIGTPLAGTATGSLRIAAISGLGVVVIGAIAMMRVTPTPEKADKLAVFDGGVVQLQVKEAVPRVIPWSRLGHLYVSYLDPADSEQSARWDLHQVWVTSLDGVEIAASTGYGHQAIVHLRDELERTVTALRLPVAIDQYDSGMPVSFGHLTVSQQGISWKNGGKHAAWADIRGFEVSPHELAIFTNWFGGPAIQPERAPDWCVAISLIREIASRHGITEKRREG